MIHFHNPIFDMLTFLIVAWFFMAYFMCRLTGRVKKLEERS